MQYIDNWLIQMRKGFIEMCVLSALEQQPRYGYDLVRALVDMPGVGITDGTVYPLLNRLRVQGLVATRLVESEQGPARKYYSLTVRGRQLAADMTERFDELVNGHRMLLDGGA